MSKQNYLQLRKLPRRFEFIHAHQFGSINSNLLSEQSIRDRIRTCRILQSMVSLGKSLRGDSEQMGGQMTHALTSEGMHGRYNNLESLGHAKFCVYSRRRRHVSFIPDQSINRDHRENRRKTKNALERVNCSHEEM